MGCWGKGRHLGLKIKASGFSNVLGCFPEGELPVVAFAVLPIPCMHPSPPTGRAPLPSRVLAEPGAGEESLKGACKLFQLILG